MATKNARVVLHAYICTWILDYPHKHGQLCDDSEIGVHWKQGLPPSRSYTTPALDSRGLEQALSFWSYIRPSIRGNVDYVTADPLPRLPPGKVKKATALCSSRRLGFSRFSRGRPNAKLDVCDLLRGPDMPATQPGHLRQHISTAPSQRNFTASWGVALQSLRGRNRLARETRDQPSLLMSAASLKETSSLPSCFEDAKLTGNVRSQGYQHPWGLKAVFPCGVR